ncbi:MAG: AAA family ATPase [Candidatus Eremiobacteraeota bacterium]|nr:AAA family ATPase [Candidatus Eremiobacteraeota bacterium]
MKPFASDARGELIGRGKEAAILNGHRHEAADGHGRVVLVAGEAGVGKSRLLRHFEMAIAGTRSFCALARCVEFVQTPLSPLRDLLMQLDVRGSAHESAAAAELIERLTFERYVEPEKEPLPVGALFDSIDSAFSRCALRRTTILLIEDLHWADRSTIAFLTYLADRIRRRRLLVVATYRAEELVASHPRLADVAKLLGKECVAPLDMMPLDERSSRTLAEAIMPHKGALDSSTLADIVRRSQGNPFFIEELVKAGLARDAAGGIKRLPLSVRGAVLARAAMLADREREILSMAAVLGERFSIERLVSLLGGDRDEVLKALERARSLQLVYDSPEAQGTIAFRHALTQEVLYDELLAERLRPLHETIARELELSSDPSAVSVELAHHWRRAGNRALSARYAEIAGDRAFAIGAMADAILYYERALADGDSEALAAGLLHKLGLALGSLNELDAGIERLRQAGDRYWRLGELEAFAENASALGAQLYNSGDPAAGMAVFREAIEALEPKLPAAKLDLLRARLAFNCVAALDFDSARAFLSGVHEPIAEARTATHFYQTRFKVAAMYGDIESWRRDTERALEAARRLDDGGSRLRHTHCQIALDAVGFGETNLARRHFEAVLHGEPGHGEPKQSLASAASAIEHILRGDFDTATRLLDEAARASTQSFAIHIHVKGARLVLGICSGDVTLLRRDDVEPFLHYGATHGMNLALGLLGGPYAWALGVRGELEDAAAWIARLAAVLPCSHRFVFAYLASAQFGANEDVLLMRRKLADAAARPQDRVNKAGLALFDAFAAQRGIVSADQAKRALEAASAFEAIGWPWLAALGYELGGEAARARDVYRAIGALRDLRRVEMRRPDATAAILSPREREVADLAASGHSNDEIARMLHISLRTVEKHVSSALRKLNLRSRVQLGVLLARP